MLSSLSYDERKELRDYLDRCKYLDPEARLCYMGELRDFLYEHMTPEGRKFFQRIRTEGLEDKL